jgi:hypothetical protein
LPLSRATALCLIRRATSAARRAPALALGAVGLVLGLPPLLYRASTVAAADLGPALARPEVARAALVGAALPCVAAGFALAISASMRKQQGAEVASAPVRPADRAVAALVAPVATLVMLALPTALAVFLPLAKASPGGAAATPVLLVTLGSVVGCSGAGAMALRLALSRQGSLARGALALAGCALVTGTAAPLEPAARALSGGAGAWSSLLLSSLAAAAGLVAWSILNDSAPPSQEGRRRSYAIAHRPVSAIIQSASMLLVRRRDIRAAGVGALVIGSAGLVVARLEDAPPPTGALLAAAGAAVALAPVGLSVGGATLDGREVWQTAPRPATEVALGWMLASLGFIGSVLALVAGLSLAARALPAGDVVRLLAMCVGAWACAVTAGALVPWRRVSIGEQAVSIGAFGLLVACASFLAGRIGPWATGVGMPSMIVAAALLCTLVGAAFGGLTTHVVRRR